MTISDRKERDRQEMRRMILDHAKKLFLKEGFENVTIRNIAESMEYSPATVYLYFKDKDEMYYALHVEGFQKLVKAERSILSTKDPLERLRKCGEVYIRFALENPEYYDLMFIMSATGKRIGEKDKKWAVGVEAYDILKQIVHDCMEAGAIPRANVDAASFALWSLVHGMAALIIRKRCIMIPEENLNGLVQEALAYVMQSLNVEA